MGEPPYAALQREVQRKLGRCLIRIQQYELLLREMVSKREVSGTPIKTSLDLEESGLSAPNKTMGQLIGELTKKYFQPTLLPESGEFQYEDYLEDGHHTGLVRLRMSVAMTPDAHTKLSDDLQKLVHLRNDLVHHFVEGQDLISEVGCIAADLYLQECYAEIDKHFTSLRVWAASMNEANQVTAAFLSGPEFKEFLRAEMTTSVSKREAALPRLIELFCDAEKEHAVDGWTSLNSAIASIRKVAPDEAPKKHGFASWRHVLHDASVFEIRKSAQQPSAPIETLYRSR